MNEGNLDDLKISRTASLPSKDPEEDEWKGEESGEKEVSRSQDNDRVTRSE